MTKEDLQQEIAALKNKVSELEKEIGSIPNNITYDDIIKQITELKNTYFITADSKILSQINMKIDEPKEIFYNNVYSENVCKQILALIKVKNTAYYLNGMKEQNKKEYIICIDRYTKKPIISYSAAESGAIYFESPEQAGECIKILGEKTIQEYCGVFV